MSRAAGWPRADPSREGSAHRKLLSAAGLPVSMATVRATGVPSLVPHFLQALVAPHTDRMLRGRQEQSKILLLQKSLDARAEQV